MSIPTVEETIAFIRRMHAGQVDKAGQAYWMHPLRVMQRLGGEATENEKLAALLHDVLEDCDCTHADLQEAGFPEEVLEAIELLTRPKEWRYFDWIDAIATGGNEIAIRVKIADAEDNSDPVRIAMLPAEERLIAVRYERVLAMLRPALADVLHHRRTGEAPSRG